MQEAMDKNKELMKLAASQLEDLLQRNEKLEVDLQRETLVEKVAVLLVEQGIVTTLDTYLEKVSESLDEDDEELSNELLTIITEVTNFKDENGKHIENYLTWYSFIKILSNISNKYIEEKDIKLLNLWLKTEFHNRILFIN